MCGYSPCNRGVLMLRCSIEDVNKLRKEGVTNE